ncbi:hypothetical protein EAF04_003675 [Stromatinia cepivora]|nr:hypothetical protein EAF04_003675 [Stromatinia cepivora]
MIKFQCLSANGNKLKQNTNTRHRHSRTNFSNLGRVARDHGVHHRSIASISSVEATSYLPYHEPDIITILVQSTFLPVLNIVNHIFKFCGLIANVFLSAAVALTGIAFPIALSFSLLSLASATPLQAFAASAALCSTSPSTTFTILSTSRPITTRLGVVLTSRAMIDDVVSLLMVQVISNLGGGNFTPITVVRPVVVSIGFRVAVLFTYRFITKPATLWYNSIAKAKRGGPAWPLERRMQGPQIYSLLTWLEHPYSEVPKATPPVTPATSAGEEHRANTEGQDEAPSTLASPNAVDETPSSSDSTVALIHASTSGVKTFECFYGPALHRVFKPLFFASIGFATPITKLFSGPIIWRGIIYTILMLLAKLVTGPWFVRLSGPIFPNFSFKSKIKAAKNMKGKKVAGRSTETAPSETEGVQLRDGSEHITETSSTPQTPATANEGRKRTQGVKAKLINRPLSLYPAAMLGTAMTARGEIGFLIASLAETTGVFSSTTSMKTSQSSEIYLTTTWAIVLCTVIGPLSIGTLVKRVRRLEHDLAAKGGNGRKEGPLGIWGVC